MSYFHFIAVFYCGNDFGAVARHTLSAAAWHPQAFVLKLGNRSQAAIDEGDVFSRRIAGAAREYFSNWPAPAYSALRTAWHWSQSLRRRLP